MMFDLQCILTEWFWEGHVCNAYSRSGLGKAMSRKGSWDMRLKLRSTTYSPGNWDYGNVECWMWFCKTLLSEKKKLGKYNKAPQSSPIIIKGWYQKLMSHQIDLQIEPICQIFSCTMSSTVKKSNMNIWWYVHCSKLTVKDDKLLFNCPLLEPCGINHNHKSQKIIGGKFSAKKSETATHRV